MNINVKKLHTKHFTRSAYLVAESNMVPLSQNIYINLILDLFTYLFAYVFIYYDGMRLCLRTVHPRVICEH
jgi:hypothetical protein